jgi:tyrosyl-tRNA synthetase
MDQIMSRNIFDELSWRGLVNQVSDAETLREHLDTPGRVLYCGFDPTADSLHIGNLVPLLGLARFALAGHRPLFLLGGATGLIGDPSGKDKERTLKTAETVSASAEKIRAQAMGFFARLGVADSIEAVNNLDWTKNLSIIDFLRDVGKHFTVNYMLAKESVKGRINREETGISYTEFSYMILQAYDYRHLSETRGCTLQIGGGDQFGNITAGLECIRRSRPAPAFALTFPLITTASGAKFGKSEKGAVFLDKNLTSPYAFYQYWFNTDDRDVINYLKYFTLLDHESIESLAIDLADNPHLRQAQKRLAREVTTMIHGPEETQKVLDASQALFGAGDLSAADPDTLRAALEAAPSVSYPSLDAIAALPKLLADLGLCPSNSQARKDIKAGAISINGQRITAEDHAYDPDELLAGRFLLVRKGKKNYGVVTLGDDA